MSVYIFHVNTYKGINQFDISHVHLLKWFFYQMIIETQSSSNTQENDFFFRLTRFNGKRYHGKKNQWQWGKNSFVFPPIIIKDLLAFMNFLIRHKIRCWKNTVACVKRLATKKLIFFWLYIYFFLLRDFHKLPSWFW